MKAIWKGSISFGLISIAIELFSAIQRRAVNFNLLHNVCLSPLHYKRWCPLCKKEVSWDETIKGLKLPDGTYFTITKEHLTQLKQEKSDTLQLLSAITRDTIDPLYLDQQYYILPEKKSAHAYFLLAAALKKSDHCAIGQFTMHEKEHLCLLQPYKNGLLLITLHYHDEIKPLAERVADQGISIHPEELELAQLLLQKLSKRKVSITSFKDTFMEKLLKLIHERPRRGKTKKQVAHKTTKKKTSSLMESLKASLGKKSESISPRKQR
jgi:DNA end-binding protein Ku